MSDLSYVFFSRQQSVNPVDPLRRYLILATSHTINCHNTQAKIQERLDNLKKDETGEHFQGFSNSSLKEIFDKEPNDYWIDED